jgi:hypothetical protein
LKGWLLELIAESSNPRSMPLLVKNLRSPNDYVRLWAIHGLKALNTPEAEIALAEIGERD